MEHASVKDNRSGKVIFLSHCCLNQNAKVRGLANYPGAINPLVELLLANGIGMYQMTCPEMTFIGAMRWGHVKDQYNSPMFLDHCCALAKTVVDQAKEYQRSGYQVLGFIMSDGSPVCGLNITPQPANPDIMWGGMNWYAPESKLVKGSGVFCEILKSALSKRNILQAVPFIAVPEMEEVGDFEKAMKQITALVEL